MSMCVEVENNPGVVFTPADLELPRSSEDVDMFQENFDVEGFQFEGYPRITPHLAAPREWNYVMRRSMQEIVHRLYLGPYSAATKSKLDTLLQAGITHIICVRQNIEAQFIKPNFPDKFKYLVLDIADTATENIIQHFRIVKQFIDEGRSTGQVLVHGNAGISRSAALVLAYLMETFGLTHQKAYAILQARRFCINPNEGFVAQLREYEPIFQARKYLSEGPREDVANQRSKRSLHMCDDYIDERPDAMDS